MATKRRGNNTGTITQRDDGRWMARVSLGFVDGRMQRKTLYGATREEAEGKMLEVIGKKRRGVPVKSSTPTIKAYLHAWLERKEDDLAPRTYTNYLHIVEKRILPVVGNVKLEGLSQQHVHAIMARAKADGVSPASRQQVRKVLRAALNDAMVEDQVHRNVAALVKGPSVPEFEGTAFSQSEVDRLIEAAKDNRYRLLYLLAVRLGMRQGELIGLQWSHVDLDTGTIRVRKQIQRVDGVRVFRELKTKNSRRDLPLTESLVRELKSHRTKQLEARLAAGGKWAKQWDLVFTTRIGTPIDPVNLRVDFLATLEAAGLPPARFHDLRHSAISLWQAQGVNITTAQALSGHSSIATTAQVYTHVSLATMRDAIESIEGKKKAN